MTTKPIRLGFIGGGINSAVGTTHFVAAQMDGLFRVEAGCYSRRPEINTMTADKWGIPSDRLYTTWQEMLDQEQGRLDAIVILTPSPDHRHPVIAALRAGYAVICEKALAVSSQEATEIEDAVRDTGGFLTVTYNYTGYPMVRELRQMIQHGRLGRVEQVHIEMPQEGYARLNREGQPIVPQQWRLRDGTVPTISLDLGVHIHHMMEFLTGEKPRELVATQSSLGRFRQVVDNTMALVRYTSGIESSIWFSKAALGHRNGLRIRVYGDEASAEWFQMEPETLMFCDNRGHQTRIDRASVDVQLAQLERYNRFKAGHPSGFLEAFANLYADIYGQLVGENHTDYVFTARHAREGLLMFEAIDQSAREHRWVEIDLGGSSAA